MTGDPTRVRSACCSWLRASLAVLVLVIGAAPRADASVTETSTTSLVIALQQPAPATDEFVPVGDLPAQEQLPAAPLLIAAYVFVWGALLVYVFMLWRRLSRVEHELLSLSRQVDQRRRD